MTTVHRLLKTMLMCYCAALLLIPCSLSRDGLGLGVRRRTGLNIGNHTYRRRGGGTTQPAAVEQGSPTAATGGHPAARRPPPYSATTRDNLTLGILLPYTSFGVREYNKVISDAVKNLQKGRPQRFQFLKNSTLTVDNIKMNMMKLTPSPTCKLPTSIFLFGNISK